MPSELHPTRFLAPVLTGATSTAAIFGDLIPHRPELSQLTLLENITRDQVLFGDHWGNFGLSVVAGATAHLAAKYLAPETKPSHVVLASFAGFMLISLVAENGPQNIPVLEALQSIYLVSDVANIFQNPEAIGDLIFGILGFTAGWATISQNSIYRHLLAQKVIAAPAHSKPSSALYRLP